MDLETFEEVKEKILKSPLVWYQGEMTQKIKLNILKTVEEYLKQVQYPLVIKKRIFAISEELLTNMIRNSVINREIFYLLDGKVPPIIETKQSIELPYFCLSEDDTYFYILCKNATLNDEKDLGNLRSRIEVLNDYDFKNLKDLYIKVISTMTWGVKNRVGLLVVARKSKTKFLYSIDILDEQVAYFSIIVRIKKQDK